MSGDQQLNDQVENGDQEQVENGDQEQVENGEFLMDQDEEYLIDGALVPYQGSKWSQVLVWVKKRVASIICLSVVVLLILSISLVINFVDDSQRNRQNYDELCEMIKTTLRVARQYLKDHGKKLIFRLLPLHIRLELQELLILNDCLDGHQFECLNFTIINQCCN